jgi:uncharacterized membrane protein YeaQ/YmgE (transglycosylase-associated protein family)
MTFWTIVSWIVLGALAGWIASIITGSSERVSGVMNIVVGIIGAFIGGLLLQLLALVRQPALIWPAY